MLWLPRVIELLYHRSLWQYGSMGVINALEKKSWCQRHGIEEIFLALMSAIWNSVETELNSNWDEPYGSAFEGSASSLVACFQVGAKASMSDLLEPGCPNTAWRWTLNTGCWIMISLSLSLDFLMISDAGHSVLQKLLKKQCRTSTLYWLCYCFGTTFGDCRLSSKVGDDRQANDGYLM